MALEPPPSIRLVGALLWALIPLAWVTPLDVAGIWDNADPADLAITVPSWSGAIQLPTRDDPHRVLVVLAAADRAGDGPVAPPPAPRAPPAI